MWMRSSLPPWSAGGPLFSARVRGILLIFKLKIRVKYTGAEEINNGYLSKIFHKYILSQIYK